MLQEVEYQSLLAETYDLEHEYSHKLEIVKKLDKDLDEKRAKAKQLDQRIVKIDEEINFN